MKTTTTRTRLGRTVASALGIVLIAGASLAAAAPAQAAPVATHIAKADIGSEFGATGWQTYSLDNIEDVGGALTIYYGGSITNNLATPEALSDYSDAFGKKLISWTTTADSSPTTLDLTVKNSEIESFATIRYAGAVAGTNNPGLDSSWTLLSGEVSGLTTGAPTALSTILPAFEAAGMTDVVNYSLYSQQSYSELTTLDVFGTEFTFGGPPSIPLDGITVALAGNPTVGSTLTGTTAGWPAGTVLSYSWGWDGGNRGGELEGTTLSYTVTAAELNSKVVLLVTGALPGFTDTVVSERTALITAPAAPQLPAAAAPVANSAALGAFLTSNGVTAQAQTSTGLPAGELNPGNAYDANVAWTGADSFVDVYAFSTPVLVGTFPVVNGVALINLSSAVLGQLEAGAHTLVITGQSSGAVQAVSLNVAFTLAATGANPAAPITAAALLLMLGAALVVVRRRRSLQA